MQTTTATVGEGADASSANNQSMSPPESRPDRRQRPDQSPEETNGQEPARRTTRRAVLRAGAATAAAATSAVAIGVGSSQSSEVLSTSITSEGTETSSPTDAVTVLLGGDATTTVTLDGAIVAPSPCYFPRIAGTSFDGTTLSVTIEAELDPEAICVQVFAALEYEATIEVSGTPDTVEVTHESPGGTWSTTWHREGDTPTPHVDTHTPDDGTPTPPPSTDDPLPTAPPGIATDTPPSPTEPPTEPEETPTPPLTDESWPTPLPTDACWAGDDADPPPTLPNGDQPLDPDADGVYEDLNGNCEFDADDVVSYFKYIDSDAIQDNPEDFDVNGNGNADFDDIVTLFGRL